MTSGLASSAFARHYLRNLGWCLFLVLLRCFSSDGSPHIPIWFSIWYMRIAHVCSHIRISPDQSSFAAPRSFSQLVTSFIGSWCQGIPLALFLAWPFSNSRLFNTWFSWIMQVQLEVFLEIVFTLYIKVFHNLLSWIHTPFQMYAFPLLPCFFSFPLSSFQGAVRSHFHVPSKLNNARI